MADISRVIAYLRSLKLKTPGADAQPGSPLAGTEEFGAQLAEGFKAVQADLQTIKKQGNFSPGSSEPAPVPPAISKFTMSNGPSGEIQLEINDPGMVSQGINYSVDYDTSPHFSNPHTFHLGESRNGILPPLPGQTFYGRATSWYVAGKNSGFVFHGSPVSPLPVTGGVIGTRAMSQGTGTAAPGTGNTRPIPARTPTCGYPWKGTRPGGSASAGSQAGANLAGGVGSGSSGGGGGSASTTEAVVAACEWLTSVSGTNTVAAVTATPYTSLASGFEVRFVPANTNTGAVTLNVNSIGAKAVTKNGTTALSDGDLQAGREYVLIYDGTQWQIVGPSMPISALVVGSDASGSPVVAALADTKIWIGQGSGLPAAQTVFGDGTFAETGEFTLETVNASPGIYGSATAIPVISVNGKGLGTSVSTAPLESGSNAFTPALLFGGGAVGLSYTRQIGYWWQIGGVVYVFIDIALSGLTSASGSVTVTMSSGPPACRYQLSGSMNYATGMLTLLGAIVPTIPGSGTNIDLNYWAAGGTSAVSGASFTGSTEIILGLSYHV